MKPISSSSNNNPRQKLILLIFLLCFIIVIWMLNFAGNVFSNNNTGDHQQQPSREIENNELVFNLNKNSKKTVADATSLVDDDSNGQEVEEADSADKANAIISNNNKKRKSINKYPIPSGLDQVVLNSYAYQASTHWWYSSDVITFHHNLRSEAEKLLKNASKNSADSLHCNYNKIVNKYYYTHRKPRAKEVGNIEMALVTKSTAAKYISIGEPLHRVVNPQPVQLNTSFDFHHKRMGNWHVTFVPQPADARSSPQRVPAEPEMSVALFRHALLSYGNVVTCHGSMFTSGGCLWEGPSHNALASHSEVSSIIAVALCDGWCRGYYHFSHEHLPRIAMVHDLLMKNPHARLVLSHSPVTYARQFYTDILGIPKEKIMVAGGNGVRAGVVALPTPMRCGNAFTSALVGLRRIVLAKVVPHFHPHHLGFAGSQQREDLEDVEENQFPPTYTRHNGKIRILFAERSHLSRMPRNWEELKSHIKVEFDSVAEFEETRGNEHAKEQVLRFYRADIVVGPHGANLANIMFMRPGRHVLEMASAKNLNLCYYSTAMRVNLTHHLVLHDKGKDSHYTLTREILKRHLEHAIERVKGLPP